jgi:hypothetical protein
MGTRTYTTTIEDGGRGRLRIPVPFDPDEAWGAKREHHVSGTVAGVRIRATITADESGHCVLAGAAWRRDGPADPIGREVRVTLAPEGPQRGDLAPDFAAALDAHPAAGEFFDALAQFYRRGYLRWIDATTRSPEKRAERIADVVRLLEAGVKQRS